MNIRIDDEFKSLIPALSPDERKGLEESILAEGCRDALVLWGDILIDGHNRYEICTKHGIPFQTVQRDFASRDDVKLWMIGNQLARRNISSYAVVTLKSKSDGIMANKAKARERQVGALKQNGEIMSLAIAKTTDIMDFIDKGYASTKHTGYAQKGQAEFFVVFWSQFEKCGYSIKVYNNEKYN